MAIPWTKDRVISTIQMYYLKRIPLNYKFINTHNNTLRLKASKFFGSWGNAIETAGLDYKEIKANKGWGKSFLAKDGTLYTTQTEGLIANELDTLTSNNTIISYEIQQVVTLGHNWTCDFLVTLKNNARLHLEVDELRKEELNKKIEYYEKSNIFYHKVSSSDNVQKIIKKYTKWYTIPIKDCVITSHEDPDGDAISSMVALRNYIISNGKNASIKIMGNIPKNLAWMLENIEVIKKVPDDIEIVFVLDCAPIKDRVGWELPQLPIYNIDHHISRIDENDPDNNIHVIKACSTGSLLCSKFGIMDKILSIGVYTDTLFTKQIHEVLHFFNDLNMSEEELSSYISRVSINTDKKIWELLQEIKIHRCRNGFVIAETELDYTPDIIEQFMQILMKLNESICFIYGSERNVKLRTSNQLVDVSKIAEEYGGGGHQYAAICSVEGKRSELKSKIISLIVPKISDGYDIYVGS